MLKSLLAAALLATTANALPAIAAENTLRLTMIDADGGAAALFVTPEGKSLLVDTGWPSDMPQDKPAADGTLPPPPPAATIDRIVAAMKRLNMTRLDHVLITHYHLDHVGGVHDILARIPVGEFIDHGPNREMAPASGATWDHPVALFKRYQAAIAGHKRRSVKVGDVVNIGSLKMTIVAGDGQVLRRGLPGARRVGMRCDTPDKANANDENSHSLGFLATFGKTRILDLGDLTWNEEKRLVCPIDRLGPVDVLLVTHHGSELSNNPALVNTVQPRLALVANGARKGGDAAVFETLSTTPSRPPIWYQHLATRSPAANAISDRIANKTLDPDGAYRLDVAIEASGVLRVTNTRNGYTETLPAR